MSSFEARWRRLPRTPANSRILDGIERLPRHPDGSPRNAYLEAGAHPDVVEYLWDHLGSRLPVDCRFMAVAWPVLARPDTGRIFAMATGTVYRLWLPEPEHSAALEAGLTATFRWTSGRITELVEEHGPGWLFGGRLPIEEGWLQAAYDGRDLPLPEVN